MQTGLIKKNVITKMDGVRHIRPLFFTTFLMLSLVAASQNVTTFSNNITLRFIENKGQWNDHVKYMADIYNGAIFLQGKGFKVLQNNNDDLQRLHLAGHGYGHSKDGKEIREVPKWPVTVRSHVYEVMFEGADDNIEVVPEKVQTDYNNYFIGNDPTKWASACRIFNAVVYKNVYPGIDVRYYSNESMLKYDFIVHPGANVDDIAMKYDGQNGLEVKNNKLIVKTSVGDVSELEPYCYQVKEGIRENVNCKFIVDKNTVRFKVRNYDSKETLVIDPAMVFCSFTGSATDNWGMTATYGPDGSFYAGGIVDGNGYKTTNGAIQTVYGGTSGPGNWPGDIALTRFTATGNARLYGTYIGGIGNDQPHSLVVDGQGNLILAGRSNSSNYPILEDPGQNLGTRIGYDIIVTKINSTGTAIIGSVKIGGSGDDGVNIDPDGRESAPSSLMRNYGDDSRSEVIIDFTGNVWIASSTQSSDFPTLNAFQTTKGAAQDAAVLRFNTNCTQVLFSSFLGGNADDAGFVLTPQPGTNDIFVAGGTASTDFPGVAAGVIQTTYGGGIADGFVAVIRNNALIKSTYVGTGGTDLLYGIQFDKNGFPYIMGTTSATMPITNAAYGQAGGKQFIWKLQKDLSGTVYQTCYGPSNVAAPNISPTAFLVDRCENVYVSGWGTSVGFGPYVGPGVSGMPVSPDAGGNYLKNNPGVDGSDFHFIVIKRNASALLFGCFYGQNGGNTPDHVDGGTSRFDPQGTIYQGICANCGGPQGLFPTFPAGAVIEPNNGTPAASRCNQAALKISFDFAGVGAGVRSSINAVQYDTLACVPVHVKFTDTVQNAVFYIWDFADGTRDTTNSATLEHVYNNPGFYHVMLIAIDSSTCNISDTAYITIRAGTNQVNLDLAYKKLPPCENLTYRFYNKSISVLGRPLVDTAFLWDFGDGSAPVRGGRDSIDHTYPAPGSYTVRLRLMDTSFCNVGEYIDTLVRLATIIKADFENPDVCVSEGNPVIHNVSQGGATFAWTVQGDPAVYTTFDLAYNFPSPGNYNIKLLIADSNSCNKRDSITKTVTVRPKPVARFTFSPNTVPAPDNTPTTFTNLSTGAMYYLWMFGDGDSSHEVNPVHQYQSTGTFRPLLNAYNDFGCSDTFSLEVTVLVIPYLDVPNAFRPSSNLAENRKVKVYGFGISKIKWRIFNRWGQLIFEGLTRDAAWDGTYKGKLQPMDVYTYTLEVEYFDGQKVKRSGNITLLR